MRLLKPKLEAGPAKVTSMSKIGLTGRHRTILLIVIPLLIVGLLSFGGYKIYLHYNPKNVNDAPPGPESVATIKQHTSRLSGAIDKNLKEGDLKSYQAGKLEVANAFIVGNDFSSASAELMDVKANISENQLKPYYYKLKIQIDQHNNDKNAEKIDLQALINKYKSLGLDSNAARYQKQLDQL